MKYTLKNAGFGSNLDKPKFWVKNGISYLNFHFQLYIFFIEFLSQHLGLSIFDPNMAWNNPAFFRVYTDRFSWEI